MSLPLELRREIKASGLADPVYFCRVFLPNWFPKMMPWLHRGLLALLTRETDFLLNFGTEQWKEEEGTWNIEGLSKIFRHFVWHEDPEDPDSETHPLFTPIYDIEGNIERIDLYTSRVQQEIIPRGFSKTTLCNAMVLRNVVYQLRKFIVYVSETSGHAKAQLDNVATQLEENQLILELFGALAPERNHPNPWREDEKKTLNGIWMIARGRGGQVRGLNRDAQRPDLILVDDVEDEESVRTKEQREKTVKWMASAVFPALPEGNPTAFIQILGTMLDAEAMLPTLAKDPNIITVRFGAIDPDGDMLWESHFSREAYEAKKASYRRIGQLNTFYREYDSRITNEEEQIFNTALIETKFRMRNEFAVVAIVIDPAISENAKADFTAIAVVGQDFSGGIHLLDLYMERGMSFRDQINKYFELRVRWNTTHQGVEAIAYQKALVHILREEMFRMSRQYGNAAYFEITEIKHNSDQDKIKRIQGVLAPRYAAGYITHQRYFPELMGQLGDFPNGKKDGPDVVAMAITLLDPSAGLAAGDNMAGKVPGEDRWAEDADEGWRNAV